jgi:excisionase family DNA binding protein
MEKKAGVTKRLLVRPAEAADLIGVSRSTMYALIASGAVRSVRIDGRMIRIPLTELERLATDCATTGVDV